MFQYSCRDVTFIVTVNPESSPLDAYLFLVLFGRGPTRGEGLFEGEFIQNI